MPSVTILHYIHKVNSDGTSPIVIQVIDGKAKKRTLANVLPEQWDAAKERVKPKTHPNYAAINIKISNEYNRLEKLILNNEFNMQRDFIDHFAKLKAGIDPEVPAEQVQPLAKKTFKEIIKLYITSLKSGQSMVSYESKLKYFIDKSELPDNLLSSQITKAHVDKFVAAQGKNKNSTIRTNIKIIRYASSFAAREGYDIKSAELHGYKLPKASRALKAKLNKDELTAFKGVQLKSDTKLREMQDMFVLAVYLRGMRIGDMIQLRQDYFKHGRLVYESEKNEKTFNIKLPAEAVEIVNRYLDGREFLFTFFKHKDNPLLSEEENMKLLANHVKSITANINGKLKKIAAKTDITKNISTHIARHTFAKMAIEKVKDLNMSMDLIGHSNLKEHEDYIRELTQDDDLDAAAESIFE